MLLDDEATTLPRIYQKTVDRLLGREALDEKAHAELVHAARDFAATTYWVERSRRFALPRTNEAENTTALQLLSDGLLISADRRTRHREIPDHARFLHDSLQSYLTARWVAEQERWDCFARAAGDPVFSSSRTDQASKCVSELLHMCATVFEPKWRVEETLARDLLAWSETYATVLSIADVERGVDAALRDAVVASVEISAATHLVQTVYAIRKLDDEACRMAALTSVYGAIASRLWQDGKFASSEERRVA